MRTSHVLLARGAAAFVFLVVAAASALVSSQPAPVHRHAQTKPAAPARGVSKKSPAAEHTPTVRFRFRTELAEGKMAFVGAGGDIEGIVNPTLRVAVGDIVQVGLVNNDAIEHDVVFPDFKAGTDRVNRKGASSMTVFSRRQRGRVHLFLLAARPPPGRHGGQDQRRWGQGADGEASAVRQRRARRY